jgi:selenocysteine lyase/cysteine desulfurase
MISPLTHQRANFSLPSGLHYLNCAFMAPQPRSVEAAGMAGMLRKRDPTSIGVEDFFRESDRLRERFARLVGGDPLRVAIVPSVSYATAIAGRHLLRKGVASRAANVVLTRDQFPSNVHVWRTRASRIGAEVRSVAPPEEGPRGEEWNRRLLEAIDEDTTVVALPHVHWTDGTLFQLERIGARAREVGAALVVDGTQSVGALPFDVTAFRPDLLVCAGYKWLLGPYSVALAYLGSRFDDAEPLEETWIGRAGSEDFRSLTKYVAEYRPGAARFDVGERSNFILVPMMSEAIRLLLEWRPERIQEYCSRLVEPALHRAQALGFRVEPPDWRGSHLVGLRAPAGLDPARLERALAARRVSVSIRGDSIRVSPYLYNLEEDLSALLLALADAV